MGVALGLLFLAGPISDLAHSSLAPGRVAGIAVALSVFVALYWSLLPPAQWMMRLGDTAVYVALAPLPLIGSRAWRRGRRGRSSASSSTSSSPPDCSWPQRLATVIVALTALGVGLAADAMGASGAEVAGLVLSTVSLGVLMTAFGWITRSNQELRAAREELARLAVSEERLRIARDVHDLLGHSLSVIALKSELAAKLVDRDPRRAAAELEDIQGVRRRALTEVRGAVQGYRTLGLTEAVEGAKAALAAAGIGYRVDGGQIAVSQQVESVLAWAVREGTTNVVRHSNAEHCDIRIRSNDNSAAVEVEDDGSVSTPSGEAGSGLAGLAERASDVRGTLEAGVKRGGGFRLRLTVPLQAS